MAKNSLEHSDIYPCIRAIAFFATPHRGGLFAREGWAPLWSTLLVLLILLDKPPQEYCNI
jgi:hypothetical protein